MNFLKSGIVPETDKSRMACFRHKVKSKKYKILLKDNKEILVIPKKRSEQEILYVAYVENFYEIIKNVHESTGHAGINVVEKVLHKAYYGIPRKAIWKYIFMCKSCKTKAIKPATNKVIQSSTILERIQVDFIDMQKDEVEGFRWILRAEDHFSKFQWLFPLKKKTPEDVNTMLLSLFGIIGLPKFLQTNIGPEFGNLKSILELWPGNQSLIHDIQGVPRGMEGKGFVVEKLKVFDNQYQGPRPAPWDKWLPSIAYTHNTSFNKKISMSPYRCMYGRDADFSPVIIKTEAMEVQNDNAIP